MKRLSPAAMAIYKYGDLQRNASGAPPVEFSIALRIFGFGALGLSPLQRIVNPAQSKAL
jgi:hypothetical protein